MAEEKKSFIGYCDWLQLVEDLEEIEAGKIFLWLLKYVNSTSENNPPYPSEKHLKIICKVFQKQLYEDFLKWKEERKIRSEAGRKGGLATQSKAKQSQAVLNDSKANEAVNVNVNDNVNVNVNDNVCVNTHNNIACVCEEETQIDNLSNLIQEIEILFNRCLTNAETMTLQEFKNKGFTNESIIRDLGSYADKQNPIAYMKKMIENAKIQEQVKPRVYEEQPKVKTYEFYDWLSAWKVYTDETTPEDIRKKAKDYMDGKGVLK